ncbi:MAG: LON peptidase substrate-binding domain-containing protein [Flavobacteriales bacterium]|nr:LON peptidase substrate-binding domain-containing protein [Flavobacteriales bacterium]
MRHNYEDIGLFPLRLFLLPGEQTTLHIYEPRYLQLITECFAEYKLFGIPYQTKTSLSEYGSMVSVVQILKKYDNGELDILVECTQNFKINQFQGKSENKLYPAGSVSVINEQENMPSADLMDSMKGYLETLLDKSVTDELHEFFSFKKIIKSLNLNDEEKFKFLNFTNERRDQFLKGKAKFLTLLIEQEKKVVDQFYLN